MPSRPRARSPLAIAVVLVVTIVAQLGWSRFAPCALASTADRAAPCRCCPAADGEAVASHDPTISGRCCGIDARDEAPTTPAPVVQTTPAPLAVAPAAIALARRVVRPAPVGGAPAVIARAVGPPVWLATCSLRL